MKNENKEILLNDELDEVILDVEQQEELENIVDTISDETTNVEVEIIEDDVLHSPEELSQAPTYAVGDVVQLASTATKFVTGVTIPAGLKNTKLYIKNVKTDRYGITTSPGGKLVGSVGINDLIPYREENNSENVSRPYLIIVKKDNVEIKSRPDFTSRTLTTIHYNDLYTVIEEKDEWGHLKVGGWVHLDGIQVKRILPY